jgi:hypothetical protein
MNDGWHIYRCLHEMSGGLAFVFFLAYCFIYDSMACIANGALLDYLRGRRIEI